MKKWLVLAALAMIVIPAYGEGEIVAWGNFDDFGLKSNVPAGSDFTAIAGNRTNYQSACALRSDGSIAAWGNDLFGQASGAPAGTGFIAIAVSTGGETMYALRSDGSIAAWGLDGAGMVSGAPTGPGFTAIVSGGGSSIALRSDGSIAAWGADFSGEVSGAPSGTGFTAIAGGGHGTGYALRSDGSIVAWGSNAWGEVSGAPTGTGFTAIAAGSRNGFALRADGSIAAWGEDAYGLVSRAPTGTGFKAIVPAYIFTAYALRSDGSIAAWGTSPFGPGQVTGAPTGTGFTAISVDSTHTTFALRADGSIAAWGYNGVGLVSGTPRGGPFFALASAGRVAFALRSKDVTPPTLVIESPSGGATVSGAIEIRARAEDLNLESVAILVDGVEVASSAGPLLTVEFDTLTRLDGAMLVEARARDLAGNTSTRTATVTVDNIVVDNLFDTVHLRVTQGNSPYFMYIRGPNLALLMPTEAHVIELLVPGGNAVRMVPSVRDNKILTGAGGPTLVVAFRQAALVASINAGIAGGELPPAPGRVEVTLVADGLVQGTAQLRYGW